MVRGTFSRVDMPAATIRAIAVIDPLWADTFLRLDEPIHDWPIGNTAWWQDRLMNTGARWGSDDRRVNATLWWYSASYTWARMMTLPLLVGEYSVTAVPSGGLWLRDDGYLGGPMTVKRIDREAIAEALCALSVPMIHDLAQVGGAAPAALRAILGDSVVTSLLTAATAMGNGQAGSTLAVLLCDQLAQYGAAVPKPRFIDVTSDGQAIPASADAPVARGSRRFGRRSSCCLIDHTVRHKHNFRDAKCGMCPRRPQSERIERMAASL